MFDVVLDRIHQYPVPYDCADPFGIQQTGFMYRFMIGVHQFSMSEGE
jgi:hypothetical protein